MANHGVTSMAQVEDMKVVLEAYWAVASKRIAENICMVFETHLLNAMGDDVEAALLNLAQHLLHLGHRAVAVSDVDLGKECQCLLELREVQLAVGVELLEYFSRGARFVSCPAPRRARGIWHEPEPDSELFEAQAL